MVKTKTGYNTKTLRDSKPKMLAQTTRDYREKQEELKQNTIAVQKTYVEVVNLKRAETDKYLFLGSKNVNYQQKRIREAYQRINKHIGGSR